MNTWPQNLLRYVNIPITCCRLPAIEAAVLSNEAIDITCLLSARRFRVVEWKITAGGRVCLCIDQVSTARYIASKHLAGADLELRAPRSGLSPATQF